MSGSDSDSAVSLTKNERNKREGKRKGKAFFHTSRDRMEEATIKALDKIDAIVDSVVIFLKSYKKGAKANKLRFDAECEEAFLAFQKTEICIDAEMIRYGKNMMQITDAIEATQRFAIAFLAYRHGEVAAQDYIEACNQFNQLCISSEKVTMIVADKMHLESDDESGDENEEMQIDSTN